MTKLYDNETLEPLGYDGIEIIQNKNLYKFTSDSIIFANIIEVKAGQQVLDMGTGSGIISVILATKKKAQVTAIDIQDNMLDMAQRTVLHNNLQEYITVIKQDIVGAYNTLGYCKYDVIVTNPPYEKQGSGQGSKSEHINICRREVKVSLEQIIESASKMLKNNGKFYMIHKAQRLGEIMQLLSKYHLTPKLIYPLYPKINIEADTVIIGCTKCAKHGVSIKAIVVNNQDDTVTEQIKELYSRR